MDLDYETFGTNIRDIRGAQGMSQLDLAMNVGRTQKTISKIEKGEQRIFLDDVYKLAEALQVPVGLLLVGQPQNDNAQNDVDELILAEAHTLPTDESRQALLTIVRTFCASLRLASRK